MRPHEIFAPELELIQDDLIRELVAEVLQALETANGYFYKAPASSSNKWHPSCCNVKSGLLRHVKRAVGVGVHLSVAYGFSQKEKDVVVAALLLHDIWKNDFKKHASRAGQYVLDIISKKAEKYSAIGVESLAMIVKGIRLHMGLWTESSFKKPIKEYELIELVIYTADYISSRADIGMLRQDTCDLPQEFPGEDLEKGVA